MRRSGLFIIGDCDRVRCLNGSFDNGSVQSSCGCIIRVTPRTIVGMTGNLEWDV